MPLPGRREIGVGVWLNREGESPGMDVTIRATIDEQAPVARGEVLVSWYRAALGHFFSDGGKETSGSYALITEAMSGGRDFRLKAVGESWPELSELLRRNPFYASVGFHPSLLDEDEGGDWTEDFGRVTSSHELRGGSHTGLAVDFTAGDRIGVPAFCSGVVDFLAEALDGANPAFARVEHRNFSGITDLEAGLRRSRRKSLRESRSYLRGYSWVTGVPSELAARLGGRQGLAATGAFHRVEELRSGGLLLQASETLEGYSDHAMRGVFTALAPVLPPGIPREDPAHPEMRLVLEDASGV
jgi:hypothetical protein